MQKNHFYDLCTLGAWATFTAGFLYFCMVICAFILPESIATYQATDQYFKDFESNKSLFLFLKICMFLGSIAMLGVVYVIFHLSRAKNRAYVGFFSLLAIIGYGFNLLQSVLDFSRVPWLVEHYLESPAYIQEIIQTFGVSNVYLFILSLGLPGVWAVAISFRAYNNPDVPKFVVFLGFLWGIGNLVTVFAHVFVILPLIYLVALGAFISTPIWAIAEGVFFLRIRKKGLHYVDLIN